MKRVLLYKPFYNLCVLYIQGKEVLSYINRHLVNIEIIASDYYKEKMGISDEEHNITEENGCVVNMVVANFYLDKRKRPIRTEALMMGQTVSIDSDAIIGNQGVLLGLFTPVGNSNYKTIINDDGTKVRKVVSFSSKEIEEMIEILQKTIFKEFEVSIYGKRKNRRNSESITENQLGLF